MSSDDAGKPKTAIEDHQDLSSPHSHQERVLHLRIAQILEEAAAADESPLAAAERRVAKRLAVGSGGPE